MLGLFLVELIEAEGDVGETHQSDEQEAHEHHCGEHAENDEHLIVQLDQVRLLRAALINLQVDDFVDVVKGP